MRRQTFPPCSTQPFFTLHETFPLLHSCCTVRVLPYLYVIEGSRVTFVGRERAWRHAFISSDMNQKGHRWVQAALVQVVLGRQLSFTFRSFLPRAGSLPFLRDYPVGFFFVFSHSWTLSSNPTGPHPPLRQTRRSTGVTYEGGAGPPSAVHAYGSFCREWVQHSLPRQQ